MITNKLDFVNRPPKIFYEFYRYFLEMFIDFNVFIRYNTITTQGAEVQKMPRNKDNEFDKMMRAEIAANIKKYADMRGYTQNKLSDMTGIKQSTLSGYYRATSTPNAGQIQKIALALGVNIEDIDPIRFGSKKEKPAPDNKSGLLNQIIHRAEALSDSDKEKALAFLDYLATQSKNPKI